MSEIEKMYENAGINKKCIDKRYEKCTGVCYDCKHFIYPPFTLKKQLELIKWLLKNYEGIDISKRINRFNFLVDNATFNGCHHNDKSFEESLAGLINSLWQDLTEQEKTEIRSILNG